MEHVTFHHGTLHGTRRVIVCTAAIAGMVILVVSFAALSLSYGGVRGLYNLLRPLPDFETGAVYSQRDTYRAKVAALNTKLEHATAAAYDFPYLDVCDRTDQTVRQNRGTLVSCDRWAARLYLSDKTPCQLYDQIKTMYTFAAEHTGECGAQLPIDTDVPAVVLYSITDNEPQVVVTIRDRQSQIQKFATYFDGHTYSQEACARGAFCQYFAGDYALWPNKLYEDEHTTVVLLETYHQYYRQ